MHGVPGLLDFLRTHIVIQRDCLARLIESAHPLAGFQRRKLLPRIRAVALALFSLFLILFRFGTRLFRLGLAFAEFHFLLGNAAAGTAGRRGRTWLRPGANPLGVDSGRWRVGEMDIAAGIAPCVDLR